MNLRILFSLLLALIWLPVQGHCLLERSGFELFELCCGHDADQPSSPSPCSEQACCAFESESYHVLGGQRLEIVPGSVVPASGFDLVNETIAADAVVSFVPSPSAARLSGCWQFVFRAALPVRAPSFVS